MHDAQQLEDTYICLRWKSTMGKIKIHGTALASYFTYKSNIFWRTHYLILKLYVSSVMVSSTNVREEFTFNKNMYRSPFRSLCELQIRGDGMILLWNNAKVWYDTIDN